MKSAEPLAIADLAEAWRELYASALAARAQAYAPYSHFPVGAALRTTAGRIYAGANIENASSGLTVCAERIAVWKAVSAGERELAALVVVTEPGSTPCGACRQVLSEFAVDLPVLIANTAGLAVLTSLAELLPNPFPRSELNEV
jgi:cytidine deaminase